MANKFVKSFNFGGEDNYFPLPFVSAEQNGMVLKVVNGEWDVKDITYVTKPGLYAADGMMLASWDELIDVYHMDVTSDRTESTCVTDPTSPYVMLNNNEELDGGTTLVIDEGITKIGAFAFAGCSTLTSVVIPEGVISVGYATFYACTGLTSVVIPSSVISIGDAAFNDCNSLKFIVIQNSVTSIGNYAFYRCTGLTDVYYAGTEEQWAAIAIGGSNDPLSAATIHYNYVA